MVKSWFRRRSSINERTESGYARVTDKNFLMSKELIAEFDTFYKTNIGNKEQILLFMIDGESGSGKSVAGMQWGYYFNYTYRKNNVFSTDNIVYSYDDLMNAFDTLPGGSVIIWDEGGHDMDAKQTMTHQQKNIQRALDRMRLKRFILIFICQRFHRINYTMAIEVSYFLIRFRKINGDAGSYLVYGRMGKEMLYATYRKNGSNIPTPNPVLYGVTEDLYVLDKATYLAKKDEAYHNIFKHDKVNRYQANLIKKKIYLSLIKNLPLISDQTNVNLSKFFEVDVNTITRWNNEKQE